MVHCITLAVCLPVKGRSVAEARDWYSQGDTVYHINQRSVMNVFPPFSSKLWYKIIHYDGF